MVVTTMSVEDEIANAVERVGQESHKKNWTASQGAERMLKALKLSPRAVEILAIDGLAQKVQNKYMGRASLQPQLNGNGRHQRNPYPTNPRTGEPLAGLRYQGSDGETRDYLDFSLGDVKFQLKEFEALLSGVVRARNLFAVTVKKMTQSKVARVRDLPFHDLMELDAIIR